MDLFKAIQQLYNEKRRLDKVIQSLEDLQQRGVTAVESTVKRRGRKSMGAEERRVVSERMRKYWAARRAGDPKEPPPTAS